jgi:zinc/manganese transport system permease protein
LASGVLIVSKWGGNVDLMHILFGSVLAVDDAALLFLAGAASITVITLALLYRPLVVESFDPEFLRVMGGGGAWAHSAFLVLVVLNLVAGFQAMGTLMAVGLMMLPAATARLWVRRMGAMLLTAVGWGAAAAYLGLLLSYHGELPSGPAIVLTAGMGYFVSLFIGRRGGLIWRWIHSRHLEA